MPGPKPRTWSVPLEVLYQRYQDGETLPQLATEQGAKAPQTLQRAFAKHGWPTRPIAETLRLRNQAGRVPIDQELLRKLNSTGHTYREMAEILGTSAKVVRSRCMELGLPHSHVARPERRPSWSGGYAVDKHGYVLVRRPEHPQANRVGYVRAHRIVMEQHLWRPLLPEEVVDHRDDDTSNNLPDNLRLFPSNGEHLRVTRTGRPRLTREQREAQQREAVLRARQRVAATLAALENDVRWSHVAWPRPSTAPRTAPRSP